VPAPVTAVPAPVTAATAVVAAATAVVAAATAAIVHAVIDHQPETAAARKQQADDHDQVQRSSHRASPRSLPATRPG
jgi:hypothetical protein